MCSHCVFNIGLPDNQFIYCTKIKKLKYNIHKQIKFRFFKNYSKENFENTLRNVSFPNYEKFSNVNLAYDDFMESWCQLLTL